MAASPIDVERSGSVLTLRIDRPNKRNALSGDVVEALARELESAAREGDVRVIVLTGAGSVFSAGADLAALEQLQTASYDVNLADSRRLAGLFETIYRHPKPIIGKINGHAIAGGCGLAAVCDLSVAADHAKFGFTEVRIGFVPAIVSAFVSRKLGEGRARELFLRGHLIDAARARDIGLITEVVAADALNDRVAELAAELARETSGSAIALTKELLAEMPSLPLGESLEHASAVNARARETADCRAGVAAFLRKEPPPWKRE